MSSASEIARKAFADLPQEVKENPWEKRERERREEEDRRWDLGYSTLSLSPLAEWFPGVTWDIMAFGKPGTSALYHGDGREVYVSPEERDFTLWLDSRSSTLVGVGRVNVQYVRWVDPLPVDFEGYWNGIDVNSAAEIGRLIEMDDAHDVEREAAGKPKRRRVP